MNVGSFNHLFALSILSLDIIYHLLGRVEGYEWLGMFIMVMESDVKPFSLRCVELLCI